MHRTLSAFENEWHELVETGIITAARFTQIPDQYTLNAVRDSLRVTNTECSECSHWRVKSKSSRVQLKT